MVKILEKRLLIPIEKFLRISFEATYADLLHQLSKLSENDVRRGFYLSFKGSENNIIGVLTDGDIRRGLTDKYDMDTSIIKFTNSSFISLTEENLDLNNLKSTYSQIQKITSSIGLKDIPKYIPLKSDQNTYNYVIDTSYLAIQLTNLSENDTEVAILGLGYVGLTLAAALAQNGISVEAYDVNYEIINNLNKGVVHIKEPLLESIIQDCIQNGNLKFLHIDNLCPSDSYIICVGSSFYNNALDDRQLDSALNKIFEVIKPNQHIYLRSTVPIGYSRSLVERYNIPTEKDHYSSQGPFLSFVPERTIEGNALNELKEIPQVIGSLTSYGMKRAIQFWGEASSSIIECDSIEEAEAVKLISNSYRDMTFGFSNFVALTCEKFNIDTNNLIKRSNEGYPRNNIPLPSPGVGGYCLTKDPLLFEMSSQKLPRILSKAREINNLAALTPIRAYENWIMNKNFKKPIKVLVLGLAFKGQPPTSDIRQSPTIPLIEYLKLNDIEFDVYDAVISEDIGYKKELSEFNLLFGNIKEIKIKSYQCIFVMNNHIDHIKIKISEFINNNSIPKLFFDGWYQFNYLSNLRKELFTYTAMGLIHKK